MSPLTCSLLCLRNQPAQAAQARSRSVYLLDTDALTMVFFLQDNGWFYGTPGSIGSERSNTAAVPTWCPRTFATCGILKHTTDEIPCLSRDSSDSSCSSCSSDEEDWESPWYEQLAMQRATSAAGPRLPQHVVDLHTCRMACHMFAEDNGALGLVPRRTSIWAQCAAFNG